MRTYQQNVQNVASSYDDLHEGPIHPSQITQNGEALFNFVNALARQVSETEENELAAKYLSQGKQRDSFFHSKLPSLERVGNDMARMMNEGHRNRNLINNAIQINLDDLENADRAFRNLTQGSKRPVIQNYYTNEEPKTMTDIDISDYLGGGTPQRAVQQNNNTFYVNMDKMTKALLAEQIKTNKLLGVLVQSVRDNGIKIEELPQTLAEMLAANNLPDAEIMNDAEYAAAQAADTSIDDLLP